MRWFKLYFLIDDEGYYIDYVLSIPGLESVDETDEERELDEEIEIPRHVTVRPPDGMYRPRWIEETEEWVETKPQEEFQAEELLRSLTPNKEDVEKAEFLIKTLTVLMEVDLI